MVDLSVEIGGVKFKNPVVVASATPTMDAIRMKHGIDGGAGAVIAKSLFGEGGRLGRQFPRPRFKLIDYREYPGYPNKLPHAFTLRSLEECSAFDYPTYMDDINRTKDLIKDDGVVIASLSGSSLAEWVEMCELVNKTGADWVELNNSCPFAQDMGVKMGAGAVDVTYEAVKTCADILKKPFSVKITPQTNNPVDVAKQVEAAGAYAVNMSARFSGVIIDIETAKPIPFGSMGGYGGPYLIGYGLKLISQAAKELKIPLIAGLGVWDWRDIIAYTMCGASLVQSAVGIMLQGYKVAGRWVDSMSAWMEAKGYKSLNEIRGMALPNIVKTANVPRKPDNIKAVINTSKCTKCGTCLRSCFYDAITLTKAGAVINAELCDVCGMCVEVCPEYAAELKYV
ncbi:4Fe-4S binding protein [Desulfomonile tiedjei]|uniref:dihydrouracil dehydrogenase (NAD(+)) n=1 Tax=Desulfomonile tiedjei (strain ATCC 49306 / DSM 6799 / DCB-1) TaxID=706587 RepID=I4C8L8_DESTA|nr:4Fe-4S binding protein [Desulfomonile tiedjei]AFM25909.1 dihydroorotate dehydrogenase [Desulfomonile tiedjei DSM 6799]